MLFIECRGIISLVEKMRLYIFRLFDSLFYGSYVLNYSEWDVVYCSRPTSPGGGYRSAIGRLVFKTNEMVQIVEAPDTVRNKVSFSVFGFLDGEVSLKGIHGFAKQ